MEASFSQLPVNYLCSYVMIMELFIGYQLVFLLSVLEWDL